MAIYSPTWLPQAARRVMGSIDLDPASCVVANAVVQARQFFTKEDNGLNQAWYGNVYLNPPFEDMNLWLDKLVEEKRVTQAVVVGTMAVAGYGAFNWYWKNALILIPDARIRFWHPFRADSTPRSFVAYIGKKRKRFCEEFRQYGAIVSKVT